MTQWRDVLQSTYMYTTPQEQYLMAFTSNAKSDVSFL